MKIFISGANPFDENYQSAIDNLKIRLHEYGLDANIESDSAFSSYQDLLQSERAYFIDGWIDMPNSRKAFETCHNNGIPVMFEKPEPYYADFARTFDLQKAIYKVTGVSFEVMRSRQRDEQTFFARMIFAWICIDHYNIKRNRVCRMINRDHSTITHTIDVCKSLAESPCDKGFKKMCNAVYDELFGKKSNCDYNSNKAPFVDSWTAGDALYYDLYEMDWEKVFGYNCPKWKKMAI